MAKKYDYTELAQSIVEAVGGTGNIESVQNCMTRLRFVLKDESKADDDAVKKINGVQGLVKQGGQYQVVIGTYVKDVTPCVKKVMGVSADAGSEEGSSENKGSGAQRFFKMITGCIMPIIPAMVAAGVWKGVLAILSTTGVLSAESGTYIIMYAAADAVLYFLPIIIGFNAGKVFGANQIVTAVIGGALMYPTILEAVEAGTSITFLGIPVQLITYSQTILPILLAAWLAGKIQKAAEKVIPRTLQLILVPAIVLGVTVPVSFIVIGPVMTAVSSAMSTAVMFVFNSVPVIGGIIFGGFWQLFVLLGIHTAFIPVLMNNLFTLGYDPINAVMGVSVWAIAGIALGYGLKVRDKEKKSLGFGNALTGLFGVTEPTIYSLALPNFKLFICAMIGGGIGGAVCAALGVKMYNYVGDGLFRIPAMINPEGIDISFYGFIVSAVIAFVISAILAFIVTDRETGTAGMAAPKNLGKKKNGSEKKDSLENKDTVKTEGPVDVYAPINGKTVPVEEVNDPTFAEKTLGDGVAVVPSDGLIKAPADAEVVTVMEDSRHAVGLELANEVGLLIHAGIDTVKLNGEGFELLVKEGDRVKKGQPLIRMNLDVIKGKGFDPTVMVIVTDTGDKENLQRFTGSDAKAEETRIMQLS